MKTTIDIPDELIEEAKKAAHCKTKKEAIMIALSDYIKKMRIEQAINMEGKLKFSDNMEKTRHER
jgi:Arc/MetJ family transcription regulator